MQKCIRRGDEQKALYFASEMEEIEKGSSWLWNRLRVIASEDIGMARPSMPILIDVLAEQHDKMKNSEHRE